MIEHGVRPKATWRGLDGHEREWRPTDTRMTELHYKLERFEQRPAERKEETGILAGASTLSNKFEFVGEAAFAVRGQVPRKLIEQVSACFNRRCRIWYEETQIHDPNTDRVKRHQAVGGRTINQVIRGVSAVNYPPSLPCCCIDHVGAGRKRGSGLPVAVGIRDQ